MPEHRFPPPWFVDEADSKLDRRCFILRDADGRRGPFLIWDQKALMLSSPQWRLAAR